MEMGQDFSQYFLGLSHNGYGGQGVGVQRLSVLYDERFGVVLGIEVSGFTGLLFERLTWRGAFTLSDRIDHIMS